MSSARQEAQQAMIEQAMHRPGVAEIVRIFESIKPKSALRTEEARTKFAAGGNGADAWLG